MKISPFRADITPPIGHPLCAGWYPPAKGITDRLSANGVVLLPDDDAPIVLCALDWAEVSNGDYDVWTNRLAKAAGTTADRVTVHCIHAHDAPWPDRDAQKILDEHGAPEVIMQFPWCDQVVDGAAVAVAACISNAQPVTEIRTGRARVDRIASNRRVMGPDGKVKGVRWTRCREPEIRNAPEGLIDPFLKTISFWNGDKKIVAMHYYAVHPTSYDGTGLVTTDFAGIARERMIKQEGVPHIYFTECSGNITAGKYNDGIADNRELFTQRMFDAMVETSKQEHRYSPSFVKWKTAPVILPPRDDQSAAQMLELIRDPNGDPKVKSRAAIILAYRRRCEAGRSILITALHLGKDIISVHTPGESFIEYQLFAQKLRPAAHVVVPSYGDCGPGYVTMARSFEEGGYEPRDSFCSGQSELILKDAIRRVL
jgi:hypothetical protein